MNKTSFLRSLPSILLIIVPTFYLARLAVDRYQLHGVDFLIYAILGALFSSWLINDHSKKDE